MTKQMRNPIIEWDVYIGGKWHGVVNERKAEHSHCAVDDDEYARCAAIAQFDIPESAEFSVSPRH